jgi:hypothetical protein
MHCVSVILLLAVGLTNTVRSSPIALNVVSRQNQPSSQKWPGDWVPWERISKNDSVGRIQSHTMLIWYIQLIESDF